MEKRGLERLEDRLRGVELKFKPFRPYADDRDHDHCSFCGATFSNPALLPNALHEGYATLDDIYWICKDCFRDYRERFGWMDSEDASSGGLRA